MSHGRNGKFSMLASSPVPVSSPSSLDSVTLAMSLLSLDSTETADAKVTTPPSPYKLPRPLSTASLASVASLDSLNSKTSAPGSPHSSIGIQQTLKDLRREMVWKLFKYQYIPPPKGKKYLHEETLKHLSESVKSEKFESGADAEALKELWPRLFRRITEMLWKKSDEKNESLSLTPFEPVIEAIIKIMQSEDLICHNGDKNLGHFDGTTAVTSLFLYAKDQYPKLMKEMSEVKLEKQAVIPMKPKAPSYLAQLTGVWSSMWNSFGVNFIPQASTQERTDLIKPSNK